MAQSTSIDRSIRVFVALPIPGQIAEELARWTQAYREKLSFRKWTHPHDYHITLQFLGETPQDKVEALKAALRNVKFAPMTLSLNGAGTFGSPKAPRVLWSAVSGDLAGLSALHRAVIDETRSLGYVPEDRPYTSHITLARSFTGGDVLPNDVLETAPSGAIWEADRFVLTRTHMNESPMYEVIDEYK